MKVGELRQFLNALGNDDVTVQVWWRPRDRKGAFQSRNVDAVTVHVSGNGIVLAIRASEDDGIS